MGGLKDLEMFSVPLTGPSDVTRLGVWHVGTVASNPKP